MIINCLNCSKKVKSRRDRIAKFCSYICHGIYVRKTIILSCLECGKNFETIASNSRKFCSRKCADFVKSKLYRFGNVPNWKGDKVSYRNLHKWVSKWRGVPQKCSHCGKRGSNKRYHWANISKKYKRDLTDWIRLCAKCHKEFDSQNPHPVI